MQDGQELESGTEKAPEAEVVQATTPAKAPLIQKSKWAWLWLALAAIVILLLFLGFYKVYKSRTSNGAKSAAGVKVQDVDTSNLTATASTFDVKSDRVVINGQLQAAQSLVILASGKPANPLLGQVYLDQTDKNMYYYNGTAFVPIGASTTTNITNITNNFASAVTGASGVTSLQGQTGALTLQGSNGLSITGSGSSISLNLAQDITTAGNPQFQSVTTDNLSATTGDGITFDGTGITFTSNGLTFKLPGSGGSGQTICTSAVSCAAGGGIAVLLAPEVSGIADAQVNSFANRPSIYINNTGGSDLFRFQNNGTDVLSLTSTGDLTVKNGGTFTANGYTNIQADLDNLFQIQNTGGTELLSADSNHLQVALNGSNSAQLDTWAQTNPLAQGRFNHGSFTYGGNIYVVNGDISGGTASIQFALIKADGTVGTWADTTDAPTSVRYGVTVAGNGHVYVIGGDDGGAAPSDSINYARIDSDGTIGAHLSDGSRTWYSTQTKLINNVGLVGSAGVYYNGYVYVAGGASALNGGSPTTPDATTAVSTVQFAKVNSDGTIGTFTATSSLPAARVGGSLSFANGRLYFVGGQNTAGTAQTQFYYASINSDGTLSSWSTDGDTTLPLGRSYHSAVVLNGYIYIMGGGSSATTANSTVYAAPILGDGSLGVLDTSLAGLNTATSSATSVTANGYIYTIGGITGSTRLPNVQYTSAPRVLVGGSLDLVNLSGQDLLGGSTAGTLTAGNTRVLGSLDVSGETRLGDSLVVNGSIQAGSQFTLKSITNSETAFQIQNASGESLFQVDTANTQIQPGFARKTTLVQRVFENRVFDDYCDIGQGISIAMGSDGKPLIAAVAVQPGAGGCADANKLVIFKCDDVFCTDPTKVNRYVFQDVTASSNATSIAIGKNDGLPIITFKDTTNGELGVLHCGSQKCDSGNQYTHIKHQSGAGAPGQWSSVAIGSDTYPIIASYDGNSANLVFTHCKNTSCTQYDASASIGEEPYGGGTGSHISMAINPLTLLPTAAHYASNGNYQDLLVTTCLIDSTCKNDSSGSETSNNDTVTNIVSDPDNVGRYNSIAFTSDGKPSIVSVDTTTNQLFYVRCGDATCSSSNTTKKISPPDGASVASQPTGLIISEGKPLITYKQNGTSQQSGLGIALCEDLKCNQVKFTLMNIDTTTLEGTKGSLLLNYNNGLPIIITGSDRQSSEDTAIVGHSVTNNALAVGICADPTCFKLSESTFGGGVSLGTAALPFANLSVDSINATRTNANLKLTTDGDFYVNSLSVTASGESTFSSTSQTALRVENGDSGSLALNVDSSGINFNLIRNFGTFETNINGWQAKGSGVTLTQDTVYKNTGSYSLLISTTANANDGATYPITLTAGRKYAVRFRAIASSGTVTGMTFGYAADGATETNCSSAQTLSSSTWTQYSCIFTPGTISGNPYFYIKKSDLTSSNINIDDIVLVADGNASSITNGTFENASDVTPWVSINSAVISHNTNATYVNSGTGSMQITTTTTNPSGAYFPIQLTQGATYTARFSVKSTSTMSGNLEYGFSADGSVGSQQQCNANLDSVSSTSFKIVSCTFSVPNTTTNTPFFYIQKASTGIYTFYVDDLELVRSSRQALASNGDVEDGTTLWGNKGSSTIAQNLDNPYFNNAALEVTTTTAANDGAKYYLSLSPNTSYTAIVYAKLAAGSTASTITMGYSADGSTEPADTTYCSNPNTLSASGWTALTCTFTTNATTIPNTSSKSYFYIEKTSGVNAPVFYLDALQIYYGSSGFTTDSKIAINSTIISPTLIQGTDNTTTAFRIQDNNGQQILNVDTLNQTITVLSTKSDALSSVAASTGHYGLVGTGFLAGGGVKGQGADGYGIYGSSAQESSGYFQTLPTNGSNTKATVVIQANTLQTADLVQLQDESGLVNGAFNSTGEQLTLGRIAASGTVTQGKLILSDGTTSNFGATILQDAGLLGSVTYHLTATTGGTYDICTSAGNCAGTGDILNGGQTGPITIGTTDATALNLITNSNNVLSISSGGNTSVNTSSSNDTLNLGGGFLVEGPSTLTTLSGVLLTGGTTINVGSTTGYPSSGTLLIKATAAGFSGEIITYDSKTATSFHVLSRGAYGTTDKDHAIGATVDFFAQIVSKSTSVAPSFAVLSGGKIMLGTADSSYWSNNNSLHAGSGAYFGDNVVVGGNMKYSFGDSTTWIQGDTTSDFIALYTNNTEKLRVNSSGNLGINNTNPGNKLSVNVPTTTDSLAQALISTGADANKGLVIQGFSPTQSGAAFEVQSSTGTPIFGIAGTAGQTYVGQGGAISGSRFTINTGLTTNVGETIRGTVGQTADLFRLQDSSINNLLTVSASGQLTVQNNADSTTALSVLTQSGSNAFTVDTTNNRATVGDSSFGGALPTLTSDTDFVLVDSDTAGSDVDMTLIAGGGTGSVANINFGSGALGTNTENRGRIQYDYQYDSFRIRNAGDSTDSLFIGSGRQIAINAATSPSFSPAAQLQINNGTTGNGLLVDNESATGYIFQAQDNGGSNVVFKINDGGSVISKPSSGNNSTTFFQIQDASAVNVFNVDTTNLKVTVKNLEVELKVILDSSGMIVTDNGGGTPASGTLNPTTSNVQVDCQDTDGCDITMGETGATDGQIVHITCTSSNTCNFADTAGVSELSGAFTAGQYDTLNLMYISDRWVEISRSDN